MTKNSFHTLDEKPNKHGIWWLASYPKSGNTWIRMFINTAVTGFPPNINASFQYATGDLYMPAYQMTCPLSSGNWTFRESIYLRPAALINHLTWAGRDVCLKTHFANLRSWTGLSSPLPESPWL